MEAFPPHPLADKTVLLKSLSPELDGQKFRVEDWWLNVYGESWQTATGNPACIAYAVRLGFISQSIPADNDVVYGKIGPFGYLVHVSELGEEA